MTFTKRNVRNNFRRTTNLSINRNRLKRRLSTNTTRRRTLLTSPTFNLNKRSKQPNNIIRHTKRTLQLRNIVNNRRNIKLNRQTTPISSIQRITTNGRRASHRVNNKLNRMSNNRYNTIDNNTNRDKNILNRVISFSIYKFTLRC